MELNPRQAAFVVSEMENIENAEGRLPSEKREAQRIREQAEAVVIE